VVLMLTSGDRGDDVARCRTLGISSYLTKPVRRTELRAAIVAAMAAETLLGKPSAALHVGAPDLNLRARAGSSCRVLLAEDNAINQRVALLILEKAGHRVATAENGKVALRMLEEQPFDLILMDVQMPEMDGFEATTLVREMEKNTGKHIPIIAMTAHAMAGDRHRCLDAGMDNYISKPIAAAALLELVSRYSEEPLPALPMAPL
jgi:two-component system sensor histidine kinase/response regulator